MGVPDASEILLADASCHFSALRSETGVSSRHWLQDRTVDPRGSDRRRCLCARNSLKMKYVAHGWRRERLCAKQRRHCRSQYDKELRRGCGRGGQARSGCPCARHGRGVEGEDMKGDRRVQSFEGPDGGNLTPMGKGIGPEHRLSRSLWSESARGCPVEALGAASNRMKMKRCKACVPWGESADSVKPRYPLDGRVYWRRFGVKLRGLTRGDLSASVVRKHQR